MYPDYPERADYDPVPQGYGQHGDGQRQRADAYGRAAYDAYAAAAGPYHSPHSQQSPDFSQGEYSDQYYQGEYGEYGAYGEYGDQAEDPYGGHAQGGYVYPHDSPPPRRQARTGSSGSRSSPSARPPPTEHHHKLHVRQRTPKGGDDVDYPDEGDQNGVEQGDWEPDPTGARQNIRAAAREGRSGGGDSEDSDEGSRHPDPALAVQRLGKIRQAQQSHPAASQGNRAAGGGAPGDSGVRVQDVERPPVAAQWQCGQARVKLRQSFNAKEIDVTKIMGQYDTDEDCKLEHDEFLMLLQDYDHWAQHINSQEVDMVLALADLDHDDCIEPNEVLYALKVWFAYIQMPRSVGPVLATISDGPLPAEDTIREALLLLNEEHPVSDEEAAYVRHLALALGGSEPRVTARQMRMAISAWYLHIERKQSGHRQLAKNAMTGTQAKICENNPLQKFCRGHCDPMTLAALGLFFVVWVLIPVLAIWVGEGADTGGYPCERPMLSQAIKLTGWLALLQGAAGLLLTGSWECTALQMFRMAALVFFASITMGLVIMWLMGFWQIMTTNPSRCGFVVWEFGNIIWIFVPALSVCFICCGMPCIYLNEYFHDRKVDKHLMEEAAGKDSGGD